MSEDDMSSVGVLFPSLFIPCHVSSGVSSTFILLREIERVEEREGREHMHFLIFGERLEEKRRGEREGEATARWLLKWNDMQHDT